AEESYVAIAVNARKDPRFLRLEGPATLGDEFAVRATVAYKGAWVRMVRTVVRGDTNGLVAKATAQFAAAVTDLPQLDKLAALRSYLVETARTAQPLDAVAGSAVPQAQAFAPGAIVTVQALAIVDGTPILLGAPAIAGRAGTPGTFLVAPTF
ncbi:MAG: hypothetical protein ABSD03_18515, partial [Vulcanimicrobiaceae bacterium]